MFNQQYKSAHRGGDRKWNPRSGGVWGSWGGGGGYTCHMNVYDLALDASEGQSQSLSLSTPPGEREKAECQLLCKYDTITDIVDLTTQRRRL